MRDISLGQRASRPVSSAVFKSALSGRAACAGAAFVLAAALGVSSAHAKVLAKVNGVEITDEDLAVARDDIGPGLPQQLEGPARDAYLLDYLVDGKIVAQKALADKLDATEDYKRKVAYYREKMLMEAELNAIAKSAVTDASIQRAYDDVAKLQKPESEVHARHILVENEADAKKVQERLKGGEDFAKVAGEVSKDPGSKGGDLGWFTKDRMVPEFAETAFKLETGQTSDPVKSQFGWHIIRVDGKREKEFPKLDQVREQVSRYVVQKAQSDEIMKLRESAKVERMENPADKTPVGKDAPEDKKDAPEKK